MITARAIRPWPTRPDPVVGLQFAFDEDLKELVRTSLAALKDEARDPARRIYTAGGWLGELRTWYAEPAIWMALRSQLLGHGYQCVWEGPPLTASLFDREPEPEPVAPRQPPPAPPPTPPLEHRCRQCRAAVGHRRTTLIYSVQTTGEPVTLFFCNLACQREWAVQWAGLLESGPPAAVPA